ncbi:MAG: hypothetical protein ABSG78_12060 [Verrucomicrobiota bacterium]|jgi:hypothetical protein
MSKPHKGDAGVWEDRVAAIFKASEAINGKLQVGGRESGVINCPFCKTRKLRYSRSADSVNYDGRCTNPGCGFSWRF